MLYKAPSFLRTVEGNQKVGLGLFSSVSYSANEKIAVFKGDVITPEQYDARVVEGRGGYCIQLTQALLLDCFNHRDVCYASHANTANGCNTVQCPNDAEPQGAGELFNVTNNCKIVVSDVQAGTVTLVANRHIPAHRELLFPYGGAYVLPAP